MSHLYQCEEAARGQKLLPCHSVSPLDPIQKLELPFTTTPVCSACIDETRAGIGAEVYANWQDTLKRKYAPAQPAASTNQSHRKPKPSLDDLA